MAYSCTDRRPQMGKASRHCDHFQGAVVARARSPLCFSVPQCRCAFTWESACLSDKCVYLPAQTVCLGDKCVSLPVPRACLPGEPRASRSRPGSRRQPGVSGGAHSSRGRPPPSRCDTAESDHDCPCSPARLPAPAGSDGTQSQIKPLRLHVYVCFIAYVDAASATVRETRFLERAALWRAVNPSLALKSRWAPPLFRTLMISTMLSR